MDLDALLDGRLKERLARKGNLTISEFMLDDVKIGLHELRPDLDPQDDEFRTAVILLAAAFVVGPYVDRLVQFTGYAMTFVAGIAHRMQASGLWADGKVRIDDWFDGDKVPGGFWLDCLVACGIAETRVTEGGERQYRKTPQN